MTSFNSSQLPSLKTLPSQAEALDLSTGMTGELNRRSALKTVGLGLTMPALAGASTALLPSEAFAANNPPTRGSVSNFKTLRSYPPAPNVAFQDRNGQNVFTKQFRNKPILITFWSVNCHACLEEMPTLDRIYNKAERAGFKVLPISIDKRNSVSKVRSYYQRKGHNNLPIYTDAERLMFAFYNGYATPMSFIVDRKGHVAGGMAGVGRWDTQEAWNLLSYYA